MNSSLFAVIQMMKLACVLPQMNYYTWFVLTLVSPLVVFALLFALNLVIRWVASSEKRRCSSPSMTAPSSPGTPGEAGRRRGPALMTKQMTPEEAGPAAAAAAGVRYEGMGIGGSALPIWPVLTEGCCGVRRPLTR